MYDTVELIRKHKLRFASPPLIDQGDADEWLEKNLKPEDLVEACAETGQEINLRYQKVWPASRIQALCIHWFILLVCYPNF